MYDPRFDIDEVKFIGGNPIGRDCYELTIIGYDTKNRKSWYFYDGDWVEYQAHEVLRPTFSFDANSGEAVKRIIDV